MYSSVILLAVAKHESNPRTTIRRLTSTEKVRAAFDHISEDARALVSRQKSDALVPSKREPTHEWDYSSQRVSQPEAIRQLEHLGLLAVAADDLETYSLVLRALLDTADAACSYEHPKAPLPEADYRVKQLLRSVTQEPVANIVRAVVAHDRTGRFSLASLRIFLALLTRQARRDDELPALTGLLLSTSWDCGRHLMQLDKGYLALDYVIVARQLIERRALHLTSAAESAQSVSQQAESRTQDASTPSTDVEGLPVAPSFATDERPRVNPMDVFAIADLTRFIRNAAAYAIERGETDFLYRCLEALYFTGCTAVERELYHLAKECARGLCHLGRLSRARKLECHWDKCALTPLDHAAEKIGRMAGCVQLLPAESRSRWLSLFTEIYARLFGVSCTLTLDESTSPPTISLKRSRENPHRISFASEEGARTIDFSDEQMLKDIDWL